MIILNGKKERIAKRTRNQYFGESVFSGQKLRAYTAVSHTFTLTKTLSLNDFEEIMVSYPTIAETFTQTQEGRATFRNNHISQQVSAVGSRRTSKSKKATNTNNPNNFNDFEVNLTNTNCQGDSVSLTESSPIGTSSGSDSDSSSKSSNFENSSSSSLALDQK